MEMQGWRNATVNQLFVTTCKGNSSLQTTPPWQHFPHHVPYCPPGNINSWFRATQHQSTDTLILTNIFCIDNGSNYKEAWGEVMDIDRQIFKDKSTTLSFSHISYFLLCATLMNFPCMGSLQRKSLLCSIIYIRECLKVTSHLQ